MADYFESGFAVRTPSWHAKETLLDTAPDLATWREHAGLEWEPVKVPLYLPAQPLVVTAEVATQLDAAGIDAATLFVAPQPSGTFAVVRDDRLDLLLDEDPKARDLAVLARGVSEEYAPIEHAKDMTPLLDAIGQACESMGVGWELTTAGSVRDGKQVYACIQLDRPIELPGDDSLTIPFGVILNAHDGSGSCRGGLTNVRVVCANTYAMAESDLDGSKLDFTIRHTGDTTERLEQARVQIAGWLDAIASYETMAKHLMSVAIADELAAEWVGEFLPIDEQRMTDRQVANRRAEQITFRTMYDASPTLDGIRGTAYGLWQASVEYLDHVRPYRTADSYLQRTMLAPAPAKALARERILELAGAN